MKTFVSKLKVNSSRFYLSKFVQEAAQSLPQCAIVLDAGAGNCPYRHFFTHIQKYESADICLVEKNTAKPHICAI